MTDFVRVLVIEENASATPGIAQLLDAAVPTLYSTTSITSVEEGVEELQKCDHDVCVLGPSLTAAARSRVLAFALRSRDVAPCIAVLDESKGLSSEAALEAGAMDTLSLWDIDSSKLDESIRTTIEAETALRCIRQSNSLIHSVFGEEQESFVVIDDLGRVVGGNQRAHELFGYRPSGMVGLNCRSLLPRGVRHLDRLLGKRSPAGRSDRETVCARKEDGYPLVLSVSVLQIFDRDRRFFVVRMYEIDRGLLPASRDLLISH